MGSQLSAGWQGAEQEQLPEAKICSPTRAGKTQLHLRWSSQQHLYSPTDTLQPAKLQHRFTGGFPKLPLFLAQLVLNLTQDSLGWQHPWQDKHSLSLAQAEEQDKGRSPCYITKNSFHFASKLLVESHLTDSRVIAVWEALVFRRLVCVLGWQLEGWQLDGSSHPRKHLTLAWYWLHN